MEASDRSRRSGLRRAQAWGLLYAPLSAALIFWLILFSEGSSRSGSPIGELAFCLAVAPVLAWIAGRRHGLTTSILGLAVVSVAMALVFGFLLWLRVLIAFVPKD
jgi:hypothetical protein